MVVTGFACPPDAWMTLFPEFKSRYITLAELLSKCGTNQIEMGKYVGRMMEYERPEVVVAHDWGVAPTILGIQTNNRLRSHTPRQLLLFNGAFRDFDVFSAPHPFLFCILPLAVIRKMVQRAGGEFDKRLEPLFFSVRLLYLKLIVSSLMKKVTGLWKKRPAPLNLALPTSILASKNDPYVPRESITALARDIQVEHIDWMKYGHFPYSEADDVRYALSETLET
jgi:pimeloyl-ACP methyl ester carboxylesterase